MSRKGPWKPEEEALLKQLYPKTPNRELSKQLDRTIPGVLMKAHRLGLVKEIEENNNNLEGEFEKPFEVMTREQAMKLDKFDLLRVNWSLLELFRRELSNPELRRKERINLMNSLSNHTSTINAIMRGSEDQLGEEDDLKAQFIRMSSIDKEGGNAPRRLRLGRWTYALVEGKAGGKRVKSK